MRQLFRQLIIFNFFAVITAASAPRVLNEIDACIMSIRKNVEGKNTTKALSGFVGIGWDDLRNTPTLPILATEFKKCQTDNSNMYLLPDNVFAVPIEDAKVEKTSTQIDSFKSMMESSSNKLGVSASATVKGVSVGGSFSHENTKSKESFDKTQSIMLLNKIQYYAFELIGDENGQKDEYFLQRLEEIAQAVAEKRMVWAKFMAEVFISDFGTHMVNKATAGAEIKQETYISKSETYKGEKHMETTKTEISIGFKAIAKVSIGYESSKSSSEKHTTSNITTTSILRTRGGPNIERLSGAKINDSLLYVENLVGLKQSGKFIYDIIAAVNFPKYTDHVKYTVRELIYNATQDYYTYNNRPGCMDTESENFNPIANRDDGSCMDPKYLFASGGIFQSCNLISAISEDGENIGWSNKCEEYEQKNRQTNNTFTCPKDTQTKIIASMSLEFNDRTMKTKKEICGYFSSVFGCKNETVEIKVVEKIQLSAYWCPKNYTMKDKELEKKSENELDRILEHKVLQKLNNQPELLHMYFGDEYIDRWEEFEKRKAGKENVCELNVQDIFVEDNKGQWKIKIIADIIDLMARGFANASTRAAREYDVLCFKPGAFRSFIRDTFVSSISGNLLKIRPDQMNKLQYYPAVLKHLIPILDIPPSIKSSRNLYDAISNAPKLLEQLIFNSKQTIHDKEPNQIVHFGGAFKRGTLNPFTGTYFCPPNFLPSEILTDFNLCLSYDSDLEWDLRLGGFYDCNSDKKLCERGYSAYLGIVIDGCELYYCIRYHARNHVPPPVINKPPYTDYKKANLESIPLNSSW